MLLSLFLFLVSPRAVASSFLHHSDVRQVAIAFGVIESVADHEFVWDVETAVVRRDNDATAVGLVQ